MTEGKTKTNIKDLPKGKVPVGPPPPGWPHTLEAPPAVVCLAIELAVAILRGK